MATLDDYRSLTGENTWARHIASRVHEFYAHILEYLAEEHEDWYMECGWGERGEVNTTLHLFALSELDKARAALNHPTMQLHELIPTVDHASFAERFKDVYDEATFSKRAYEVLNANQGDGEFNGDLRMKTAQALVDKYGDLVWEMDTEMLTEKWDEVWGNLQAKGYNFRADWSA
jgi:hypothetical protein